jgi:hypothetical protein
MADEEKGDKGFRVSDRRRFAGSEAQEDREQGKAAATEKAEKPPEGQKEPDDKTAAAQQEQKAKPGEQAGKEQERTTLPEVNFSTFVVSLSSSVLIHMGVVPDPLTGKTQKDLPVAKQTIDMLGMLQDKTRGNLTEEEKQLLDNLLYDLRMRYVSESG